MSVYTEDTLFGPIVTGWDVEQWCMETIREWADTYLCEVERQAGLQEASLQRIRGWVTAPSFDKWPEDQLPAVMLVSVGLSELPLKDGYGLYRARWQMGLGCIVSARTQTESHRMAMLYIAALRTLLIQRPSLGDRAAGIVWQDEDYTQLAYDDIRTLAAGQAMFTVEVEGVSQAGAGPLSTDDPNDPACAPWPNDGLVLTHEEQVFNNPVSAPLPKGRRR